MNRSPRWAVQWALLVVACAAQPTAQQVSAPTQDTERVAPESSPVAAASSAAPSPKPSGTSEAPAAAPPAAVTPAPPTGPSACPAGMLLVEGEYCTEVEQKCLKSWYDPNNKKTICERFEEPSRCVGKKEKKRYCIDHYEYPNQAGARPEVMNNFFQAQVLCAAQDKRICTETEWTFACEGPEMKPYPYGYERDPKKCRGDQPYGFPNMTKVAQRDPDELERLWQGVPSGSQPGCVSDFGVADLPGNADELASSEQFSGRRDKFDNVTTGGPWYLGVRNQCRPKIYTHDEGFYYYYLTFRCCAEPDGAPSEPRAPKQIKRKWQFDRVERSARLTLEQAKARQKSQRQTGQKP